MFVNGMKFIPPQPPNQVILTPLFHLLTYAFTPVTRLYICVVSTGQAHVLCLICQDASILTIDTSKVVIIISNSVDSLICAVALYLIVHFLLKKISFPFPASVARFMNFSANFTFGVLKRRGMKKKGTRNWEAAGSEFPLFFKVG